MLNKWFLLCLLFPFTPRIPGLSTAGFVRAVVPGTQGPPPGSPDVSLLAHSSRGQPAMEGEMQGRRWASALCGTCRWRGCSARRIVVKWAVCLKTQPASHICLFLSHSRHRRASAPQEEENCQTWLHPQPVEMCLHQAAQNRHQLEERGPQISKGSFFSLELHIELEDGMSSLVLKSLDLCFASLKVWAMPGQHTTAGGLHFADSLGTFLGH